MSRVDDIISDFELFDDWEGKYTYIIDLGKSLPAMPNDQKIPQNIVKGCTSSVWMTLNITNEGNLDIQADSDALIVKGLIGLLMQIYNGRSLNEVRDIDMEATFNAIGLSEHLSPNRRNGFFSMVSRIRSVSTKAA